MALADDVEDTLIYRVVINEEEQYSIWQDRRPIPPGWRDAGKSGTKVECLEYIAAVWTDMRPLSLRKAMEQSQTAPPRAVADDAACDPYEPLVIRLSQGRHPVEVSIRPERTLERFKQRVDLGYVHVMFTGTRGGTELGIKLDSTLSDMSNADFMAGTGVARLCGDLSLDFVKVRCIADIDLATLAGTGHLEVLQP